MTVLVSARPAGSFSDDS